MKTQTTPALTVNRITRPTEFKHAYEQSNPDGHFFDKDAMRFFNSKIHDGYAVMHPNNFNVKTYYFVTSERFDRTTPRLYSVRKMELKDNAGIDTIGKFNTIKTKREAMAIAKELAEKEASE